MAPLDLPLRARLPEGKEEAWGGPELCEAGLCAAAHTLGGVQAAASQAPYLKLDFLVKHEPAGTRCVGGVFDRCLLSVV